MSIFLTFLKLGLTSFGGPVAHLGYFRTEFVERQQWLDDEHYADIVALCNFLPGPSSSQVGLSIGLLRGGYGGAFAAWLGFTLPSALVLIACALFLGAGDSGQLSSGMIHGLKIVAVAVVIQAVSGMARQLCNTWSKRSITLVAASVLIVFPAVWMQMIVLLVAACAGCWLFLSGDNPQVSRGKLSCGMSSTPQSKGVSCICLSLFGVLLCGLPFIAYVTDWDSVQLFDVYYRTGSLVFGGGHVVLPLLQAEVVPTGWVTNDVFLAGYGVTQAVPGPLFTFAAFLGASSTQAVTGVIGGVIALCAIFLPSFLLVIGIMPWWTQLRHRRAFRSALTAVNAAVVGMLIAVLYNPIFTVGIQSVADVFLVCGACGALMVWKTPPWLMVIMFACGGWLFL